MVERAMDLDTFIRLADAYQRLGWAVQEQLKQILEDGEVRSQNPNALALISDFLRHLERDVDEVVDVRNDVLLAKREA